jgi:hypothetical protein
MAGDSTRSVDIRPIVLQRLLQPVEGLVRLIRFCGYSLS